MDIHEIEKGMKVIVADNLDKTRDRWTFGSSDVMENMRGRVGTVSYIEGTDGVAVRCYDAWDWIFCPQDLKPLTKTKPIPPVMFDPENL